MATYSSTLAWRIPWTEVPGIHPMDGGVHGSLRVGPNWATSLSLFTFMHWRRKWQPTPVFLPGEFQGGEPGGLPSMWSHSRTRLKWLNSSSSSILVTSSNLWSFYYLNNFAILRMSRSWNVRSVAMTDCLLYLGNMHLTLLRALSWI